MVTFEEWVMGKRRGVWLCTKTGCEYATPIEKLSVMHQTFHAKVESQVLCKHKPRCETYIMHRQLTNKGIFI